MKLSQVWEGWRNKLLPPAELKELIEKTAKERLEICEKCTYHSEVRSRKLGYKIRRPDVHCTHCGCTLSAKTRCLSCSCPIKLWEAVLSEEEDDKLIKELEDERDTQDKEGASQHID